MHDPGQTIWVVRDTAISFTAAAFTDKDRLVAWLQEQTEDYLSRLAVYTHINNPPSSVRGPWRMPQKATEFLPLNAVQQAFSAAVSQPSWGPLTAGDPHADTREV